MKVKKFPPFRPFPFISAVKPFFRISCSAFGDGNPALEAVRRGGGMKRAGYISWDDYFMGIAVLSAHRSKDPARQVRGVVGSVGLLGP